MWFPKLTTRKSKIVFFSSITIILVAIIALVTTLILLSRIDYRLVDSPSFEVNTEVRVSSLFSSVDSGVVEGSEALLDTIEVGEKTQTITVANQLGMKRNIETSYRVVDTIAPVITSGEDELSIDSGTEDDILSRFQADDNSKNSVELSIEGDYDLNQAGEYSIQIVARDGSSNVSSKDVILRVTESPRPAYTATHPTASSQYYIEVNRQQNVVVVYSLGPDSGYSNIAKVFVASTGAPGSETPLGEYTITDRYEALFLVGNVWGQYAVRINGPYFFHSVPYFSKGAPWNNLEYLEYNKLGNGASAGCVRLAASDAK